MSGSVGSHELGFMNNIHEESCAVQAVSILDPGGVDVYKRPGDVGRREFVN